MIEAIHRETWAPQVAHWVKNLSAMHEMQEMQEMLVLSLG